MLSVLTVPTSAVKEGPYRTTWQYDNNRKPNASTDLFEKLLDRVQAGFDLPIHVASLQPDKYIIVDGHIAYDLYKWMGREQLQVILHDGVKTDQQALETYISMNHLRSASWMRSAVRLMGFLATLGLEVAPKLMQDSELAADLIRRKKKDDTWWQYNSMPFSDKYDEIAEWEGKYSDHLDQVVATPKIQQGPTITVEHSSPAPVESSLTRTERAAERPSKVRVATSLPKQCWIQGEKLAWLDKAIAENPCDLFLTPQEFVGGGSTREWCRIKGFETDDVSVTESWLLDKVGSLCRKHNVHIGFGASVRRENITTEDFLYLDNEGQLLGYHSKIALPKQDNITLGGASGITPETDYGRAARVIEIPKLGIRVGTVFCWQVFFMDFWNELARQRCNLVVHPIKFAPRAEYKKGENAAGFTRTGFKQKTGCDNPDSDPHGWISKLMFESEFKRVPIAVTCNTWDGGEKFLALVGWIDEVTHNKHLFHLPSNADTEKVVVTEYVPLMFDVLPQFPYGYPPKYSKEEYKAIAEKEMLRKALGIERRARSGKLAAKVAKVRRDVQDVQTVTT